MNTSCILDATAEQMQKDRTTEKTKYQFRDYCIPGKLAGRFTKVYECTYTDIMTVRLKFSEFEYRHLQSK
jgi:hypothetical protein